MSAEILIHPSHCDPQSWICGIVVTGLDGADPIWLHATYCMRAWQCHWLHEGSPPASQMVCQADQRMADSKHWQIPIVITIKSAKTIGHAKQWSLCVVNCSVVTLTNIKPTFSLASPGRVQKLMFWVQSRYNDGWLDFYFAYGEHSVQTFSGIVAVLHFKSTALSPFAALLASLSATLHHFQSVKHSVHSTVAYIK